MSRQAKKASNALIGALFGAVLCMTPALGGFVLVETTNALNLSNPAAPLPGDFDRSGTVDGDGDTDGADFLIWQQYVGSSFFPGALMSAVPEPGSWGLVAMATFALVMVRPKRL